MKRRIRESVFETNSSSVHTIAIGKRLMDTFPSELPFRVGQFGWEHDSYEDMYDRASYLWTAICYNYYQEDNEESQKEFQEWKNYIEETLLEHSVVAKTYIPKEEYYYIDHGDMLSKWLNYLREDKMLLISYLFSNDSVVCTGNDNSFDEVSDGNSFDDDDKYILVEEKGN